jgi:hypothetical protein
MWVVDNHWLAFWWQGWENHHTCRAVAAVIPPPARLVGVCALSIKQGLEDYYLAAVAHDPKGYLASGNMSMRCPLAVDC